MCCLRYVLTIALLLILDATAATLDPGVVQAAAKYSASHRGTSFLVIQGGRTIYEEYPNGGSPQDARKIYSGTKAFWNLAALSAVQDKMLTLDERVADTIPAWKTDARKSRVTVRELLDFTCGLEPGFKLHENDFGNRDKVAINLPMVAAPGHAFIYGPSPLQVFHQLLKTKLHGREPTDYLERRVLGKLHLGSQRYLNDRAGNPLLASGWMLTAREWARLGTLALAQGPPVVKPEIMAETWRGSTANPAFSLGWWNNHAAPHGREVDVEAMLRPRWFQQDWNDACLSRAAPPDLVACIGSGHQRLFVVPSLRLIVVRHGNGGSFSDARFLALLFKH